MRRSKAGSSCRAPYCMATFALLLSLVVVALALASVSAFASWPSAGLPIATGPADQRLPVGLTAPGGDAQIFWVEVGSPYAAVTQRITIEGTTASGWPAGGRGVVESPGAVSSPEVTNDGAGGYLLAWYDYRATGPKGIYAVRVDAQAALVPNWNPSGTPVCTTFDAQGGGPLNDLVRVCSDGSGGAYVAWTDSRNTPPMSTIVYDVFAQHLLDDGTRDPAWPSDGLALTGGSGYKYPQALIADGAGGFWLVTENPLATDQLRVTQHQSDGSVSATWISPHYAAQYVPRAAADGSGGVLLVWDDCLDCLAGTNAISAIRLVSGAQPAFGWPVGGRRVVTSARNLSVPTITAAGGGAAVVAWLEDLGNQDGYQARRIESNGALAAGWPAGGRTFATNDILFGWPLIVPDGAGGAMFAFRRNLPNLFGSRVTAAGTVPPAIPDTGVPLCSLSGDQFLESLVSDGMNGAYVLWDDRRDEPTNHSDIYAMRFTREGTVGSTTGVDPPSSPGGLALSRPSPNPTSGSVVFQLSLPVAARARVEVHDLSGRLVITLWDAVAPAGVLPLEWDGRDRDGRILSAGIYLLRARVGDEEASQRIALVK